MLRQWQKDVTWQTTPIAFGIKHCSEKPKYCFHSLFHDLLRWKDERIASNIETIKSFHKTWKNPLI